MYSALIVSSSIVFYLCVGAFTMVRFVAADMQHYWQLGHDYGSDDLTEAIAAGSIRGLLWPVTLLMVGARKGIQGSAYRIAERWYDAHGDEPMDDGTTHMPRHSATA